MSAISGYLLVSVKARLERMGKEIVCYGQLWMLIFNHSELWLDKHMLRYLYLQQAILHLIHGYHKFWTVFMIYESNNSVLVCLFLCIYFLAYFYLIISMYLLNYNKRATDLHTFVSCFLYCDSLFFINIYHIECNKLFSVLIIYLSVISIVQFTRPLATSLTS